MRLKFLFFPSVLIVAVALFIGVIWPGLQEYKLKNAENAELEKQLLDLDKREQNAQQMAQELENKKEMRDFMDKYLPVKPSEERILDSVNYVSVGSGVALAGIEVKEAPRDTSAEAAAPGGIALTSVDPAMVNTLGESAAQGGTAAQPSPVKMMDAKVKVVGEYDKIKLFLANIRKLEFYNNIKSVTLSKQEATTDENGEKTNENVLTATMEISFGHMPRVKAQSADGSLFSAAALETGSYEAVREYAKQVIPALEPELAGRGNPFLP